MELLDFLRESLRKGFFKEPKDKVNLTTPNTHPGIETDLSPDITSYNVTYGFFDNDPFYQNKNTLQSNVTAQQQLLIREYRKTAMLPEVSTAIDEVINEAAYVTDNEHTVYLNFSDKLDMSDKLKQAILDSFDECLDAIDFNYNVDYLLRRYYTDGQLILNVVYDEKNTKKGIIKANTLSPNGFVYDETINRFRYVSQESVIGSYETPEIKLKNAFRPEEIIKIDSGIYDNQLILSHLHPAIKIANQLQSIEDLVIPLRFSRSIARRVFNVDVGDLNPAKIRQEMEAIKREYKYKKYYDIEKGTMTNTSMMTSIVEDYWFPNRGGHGGTTVDVMNETGGASFGDMGDAEYFKAKLYESLKVPLGRINGASKTTFDFTATAVEHDEQRFYSHINRLRQRFNLMLIELLKRQLSAKSIMTNLEFEKYKSFISVRWEKENNFLERERIEIFKSRLELYSTVKEYEGDIYSRKYLLKEILKMSDEEIEQQKQEIQDELKGKVDQEDADINKGDIPPTEEEGEEEEPNSDNEEETSPTLPEAPEELDTTSSNKEDEGELDKEFGPNFNAKEK